MTVHILFQAAADVYETIHLLQSLLEEKNCIYVYIIYIGTDIYNLLRFSRIYIFIVVDLQFNL